MDGELPEEGDARFTVSLEILPTIEDVKAEDLALEKLVVPYKSITAHVFREPVPLSLGENLDAWDAWLAQHLSAPVLATKPFTPLPVLGVPGWWPANNDPAYYADAGVFRPARTDPS